MEDSVLYRATGGIASLRFNVPDKLNAMSTRLGRGFSEGVQRALDDPDVRVITLTGNGRAFCAGADLSDPDAHSGDDLIGYLEGTGGGISLLRMSTKPVVVGTHGWAVGAGVEIVLAADIAIGAEDARFFLPQVSLGIIPGAGGMSHLARTVGAAWARRLVLLGDRIDAATAHRIGLITEVVETDRLSSRVEEIATVLADAPRASIILARESLAAANEIPLSLALRNDHYRLFMLSGTPEKEASHAAFRVRKAADA
jgi:enoyl-CoA hydratase/carnithine racemase